MKVTIIYPSDYFNKNNIDEDYKYEYDEAIKFSEFQPIFYSYDDFINEDRLNLYPKNFSESLCIYRGWMLSTEKYKKFYYELKKLGLTLINSPEQYENCHEFPNSYSLLKELTPKIYYYKYGEKIEWDKIKDEFDKFMIKDYVKSVKGTDFPVYFDKTFSNIELNKYVSKFIEMRGDLFTKGIVIKKFVNLSKVDNISNEYRAFYINGRLLTVSKNSNQKGNRNIVPKEILLSVPKLNSNFYTIDFAELKNGDWTIIETGDGQVSGLSPNQNIFKFYEELKNNILK